jgi:hypothetical protein
MASWNGPALIGGDFNLVRYSKDKSNGRINHKWADAFNEWIGYWGLLEVDLANKHYTWTNNQENLVMARLDRVFITTDWEAAFPLVRVKALNRLPSDHNPLLVDTGDNMSFGKKRFRFEKWWLEKDTFKEVVQKAWNSPCLVTDSMKKWQIKIRTFRRMIRCWAANEVAYMNRKKIDLDNEYNQLDRRLSREASLPGN